ncbi:MAG: flagellar export protein FliJ [Thermodesulfobacteriota bacterium]
MAYRFKLQVLLNYRQNLEEQAQLRLGREQRLLLDQIARLEELGERRRSVVADFERRKRQPFDSAVFSLYLETIATIDGDSERQRRTIEAQKRTVEEARRELLARRQERKIMDRLRQQDFDRYRGEEQRREFAAGDEQAVLRFGRGESLNGFGGET